jgi:hypothetical protein
MLRAQYDAWRATNPCPAASSDAGIGGDGGTDPMDEMGAGCCSAGADSSSLVIAFAVAMILARRPR